MRSDGVDGRMGRGRRGGRRTPSDNRTRGYAESTLEDLADEPGGIDWDVIADIVCIGRGAGALAAAVGARGNGLAVFFAEAGHATVAAEADVDVDVDSLAGRLGIADAETVDFLNALTEDVGPMIRCAVPSQVPMRTLDGPQSESRRRIATFVGSALRGWADRCLASPYGLLYTNLERTATAPYRSAGETLEAAVVGTIDVENGRLTEELDQWLAARADELGIGEVSANSLQRLVFDAGQVVGAIIDTPTGPQAVRAKRGVVMATGDSALSPTLPVDGLDDVSSVTVALVTRTASRFARLELLATPR
jgi:hypothetical protein